MWGTLFTLYLAWVRPMFKWIIRQFTGQCELLRIAYDKKCEAAGRTLATESSLKHSKTQSLKRLLVEDNVNIEEAVQNIMNIKSISLEVHPQFSATLNICLSQICGYRQLRTEVENIRKTRYSSDNQQHEALLMKLWRTLKPDELLDSRISKQWTQIGFQGDDPMTDFRGMGMLGLHNLVYFVTKYTDASKQLYSHSNHPKYGYSFAIVGINITGLAVQLLHSGHLKTHFYNFVHGKPMIEHFHQVYCYLMYEFDKFWFEEKPKDIMQFNPVKEKFQKQLIQRLKDKSTTLSQSFMAGPSSKAASVPI